MGLDEIKAAVLTLPSDERQQIIDLIEDSLGTRAPLTAAQRAEFDQELADRDRDGDAGLPWDVVRGELQKELDAVQRTRQTARAAATA